MMKNQMHFVIVFFDQFGGVKQKKKSVFYTPGAEWLRPVLTIDRLWRSVGYGQGVGSGGW